MVYHYAGQFSTAPGYGSLLSKYGKIAAGFTLPTIIIVGILYSLVTSRAIFFQVSRDIARLWARVDFGHALIDLP